MARKIYIKTAAIISLCCGIFIILSACLAPVDMDEFFKPDGPADTFITNTVNKQPSTPIQPTPPVEDIVKVDDQTGDGLKGGKGIIIGLKKNKYYMVEKEVDDDDNPVNASAYPKYVTEHPSFNNPGQMIDELGFITRINGEKIIGLTPNLNTYTVRAAVPFFEGMAFTYSDSNNAGVKETAYVNNGAINIDAPKGNFTLEQLYPQFNGYDVTGVAVSSAFTSSSPFYSPNHLTIGNTAETVKSFQLEGANTEVDYVFVKTDVPSNFFVLTVKIGAKPPTVIDEKPITGVTKPVAGETPATAITNSEQYTGTVSWSPAITGGKFAPLTDYTATITLTAKAGYTFNGVPENFFTVADTSTAATNPANSGVITAVFPKTGSITINIAAIQGVTVPVNGATPVTEITPTDQYTGTVTWGGTLVGGNFGPTTVYTATITLTEKTGYTLTGVGANFFTVAGTISTATNPAGSGVITAVFPATNANLTGNVLFSVSFNFSDAMPAGSLTPSVGGTIDRGSFDGGKTVVLTLGSAPDSGAWSDIKWYVGGKTYNSLPYVNVLGGGNILTIDNSAEFWPILSQSSFEVTVTATLSGCNDPAKNGYYSGTVTINVTGP